MSGRSVSGVVSFFPHIVGGAPRGVNADGVDVSFRRDLRGISWRQRGVQTKLLHAIRYRMCI